jgi:hypothetical protein
MGADLTAAAPNAWRTVAASVAGTSHAATGQPCADAWAVHELPLAGGGRLLFAAVADGAGSAECAPDGARVACATAADVAAVWAGENASLGAFTPDTARAWVEHVRDQLDALARLEGRERRDFAATFLVALVDATGAVFLQLGDGAIVYRAGDGAITPALWPQNGEYANTTWFVTDEEAADLVQLARVPGVDEVALLTDGLQSLALRFASREAHGPFFEPMFRRLRDAGPAAGGEEDASAAPLDEQLRAFLGSDPVNARTDDDKTLVLATRLGGGE